jgi:hypothetical protein
VEVLVIGYSFIVVRQVQTNYGKRKEGE